MIEPRFAREAWFNQHRPDPNFIALFDAQRAFRAKGIDIFGRMPRLLKGLQVPILGSAKPLQNASAADKNSL
jgi:hypothetical protein